MDSIIIAGVDVAQDWLDIHIHNLAHARCFSNNAEGMSQIILWLKSYDVKKVICEATGGLERLLVYSLRSADISCQAVNPVRIAAFRKVTGKLAKTDLLDAELIALFASKIDIEERISPSVSEQKLKNLAVRRRQVVEMQTSERNRLKRCDDIHGKESINRVLSFLEKERKSTEEQMLILTNSDAILKRRMEILTSIPGIGHIVALTLISEMPELGSINDKQIAALAGVAPQDKQSGHKQGKASIRGGRKCVRAALYMAAMSARRHNPVIKEFYDNMITRGKPKMLALTAAMRKLIIQANTLTIENRTWIAKNS